MTNRFDSAGQIQDAFYLVFRRRNWLLGWPQLAASLSASLAAFIALMGILGASAAWRFIAVSYSLDQSHPIAPHVVRLVIVLLSTVFDSIALGWMLVAAKPVWQGQRADYASGFHQAVTNSFPLTVVGLVDAAGSNLYLVQDPTALALHPSTLIAVAVMVIIALLISFLITYADAFIVLGNQGIVAALLGSARLAWLNRSSTITLWLANVVVALLLSVPWLLLLWLVPGAHLAWRLLLLLTVLPSAAFRSLATVKFYDGLLNKDRAGSPIMTSESASVLPEVQ